MNRKYKKSPKIARWIIGTLDRYQQDFAILGDSEEIFKNMCKSDGYIKAYFWYWFQTAFAVFKYVLFSLKWSFVMFRNYLKTALRNMRKHKSFSLINISGLTIGLTCCFLIMLYIHYELSFDRYHKNANEIYRIVMYRSGEKIQGFEWFNSVPGALKASISEEFPEVLMSTRARWEDRRVIHNGEIFAENDFRYVDPEFLDIFSFPLLSGDPKTALKEPFSLLLTEEMAEKYFGKENPMNKVLNIDNHNYKITGVLKNVPENSHFTFDFVASFCTMYALEPSSDFDSWRGCRGWRVYILTKRNVNIEELEKKVSGLLKKYTSFDNNAKLRLQPLTSIHLNSKVFLDAPNISDIRYVYLFSAIAFLIMVIACMNYMNLSTARSVKRSREVGIRRVVGAYRANLIGQFFGESTMFVLFALIISLILTYLLLPGFGNFIERDLNFKMISEGWMIPGIFGIILFVGLVSGSYPAILLSSFKPVNIFRGFVISKTGGSAKFRNVLIVFQFSISVVLIICALTAYKQLEFIRTSNLGFNKEHIIYSDTPKTLRPNFKIFKKEIEKHTDITEVYGIGAIPIDRLFSNEFPYWEGKNEDEQLNFHISHVDYNFLDFFGIELKKGRNFSKDFSTDVDEAWIINETAAKAIGWENPIGKRFRVYLDDSQGRVIGVVKDFHINSLHHEIEPMAVRLGGPDRLWGYHALKISSENIPKLLYFLKEKYKEFVPDYPFGYSFLDDTVNQRYQSEQKLSEIFSIFTLTAIFICCIGLFGLGSFTAEQKTKEIGIRKVFGASIYKIVNLISKKFIKWVVLAVLIAFPVAWYIMNKWLENFAYRTNIGIEIFISALLITILISFIAVGYKSYKAATANPVNSIRYE